MITLAKKIKEERDKKEKGDHGIGNTKSGRTSIRDKLLTKGKLVQETVTQFGNEHVLLLEIIKEGFEYCISTVIMMTFNHFIQGAAG